MQDKSTIEDYAGITTNDIIDTRRGSVRFATNTGENTVLLQFSGFLPFDFSIRSPSPRSSSHRRLSRCATLLCPLLPARLVHLERHDIFLILFSLHLVCFDGRRTRSSVAQNHPLSDANCEFILSTIQTIPGRIKPCRKLFIDRPEYLVTLG